MLTIALSGCVSTPATYSPEKYLNESNTPDYLVRLTASTEASKGDINSLKRFFKKYPKAKTMRSSDGTSLLIEGMLATHATASNVSMGVIVYLENLGAKVSNAKVGNNYALNMAINGIFAYTGKMGESSKKIMAESKKNDELGTLDGLFEGEVTSKEKRIEIAKYFISKGANVNAISSGKPLLRTAVFIDDGLAQSFIEAGAKTEKTKEIINKDLQKTKVMIDTIKNNI
jgi:hypothetical protein